MSVHYRQGDVLLIKRPATDALVFRDVARASPENGRVILAHGEATGHTHSVDGAAATLHELTPEKRYLEVWAPTELTHEEHAPIALEPGLYRVVRQREFAPAMPGAFRRVRD
jgi:hypothetical protein